MRFENSELRAFCAVVENNGFGRAAEALHLSQSAVSQAVANLEDKVGVGLIVRGRQLSLTDAGKRLFDYATNLIQEEQRTLSDIDRIKRGDASTLSLAISSTINRFYAPQLLNMFIQDLPHTGLHIQELPSRTIIYEVLAGRIDLGMGPFQKNMSAFSVVPLYEETRHLVVSRKHPLYKNIMAGDVAALRDTALITSALDDQEMRPSIQRIRDNFATTWEISSLSLRIHMLDQGLGLGYLNNKLLSEHPVCREFDVAEGISFGSINRQVGLYHKKGVELEPSAVQFVELSKAFWSELK